MVEKFINKKIKDLILEEKEEIKKFLIEIFKDNSSYKNTVYTNPDLNECLLLYIENKLVGHISITKRIINYKNKQYLVGGIGDVAIDKEYREKGFGNKLMKEVNKILKEGNYDLGILFNHPKLDNFYSSCDWIPKDNGKIFATVNGILEDQMRTFLLPINLTEKDLEVWKNEDINIGNGSW
ncbi:MAG: GNAT family N-acetyltransferase [Candidatus Shapirobacteria bacterium]|nr:GNAT family N-acetyltransferase [Candidatus Shapirobacteria bacterium]MDD4410128.1 GNAT family N-acetyltransferase [Candidatus Shapirobacteria bacterium]